MIVFKNLVIILILTSTFVELGAYFYLRSNLIGWDQYRNEIVKVIHGQGSSFADANTESIRLHPFFGYVLTKGNNYGFSSHLSYPYSKKENEFVIGIFGGSTAMYWAEWLNKSRHWSSKSPILAEEEKKIVVLNFAVAGMKQPQQYAVLSKFITSFDLVIFYDGWNEAVIGSRCPGEPELPQYYELLFARDTKSQYLQSYVRSDQRLKRWSQLFVQSFFYRSATLYLVWQNWSNWEKLKMSHIYNEIKKHSDMTKENAFQEECDEEKNVHSFKIWNRYTSLSHLVSSYYKVPFIHLLQPNPFIEGAKPLDEVEKQIIDYQNQKPSVVGNSGFKSAVFHNQYILNKPSWSRDLTYIFKNQSETLYIDSFTHLNDRGYEILSDEVFLRYLPSLLLK